METAHLTTTVLHPFIDNNGRVVPVSAGCSILMEDSDVVPPWSQ